MTTIETKATHLDIEFLYLDLKVCTRCRGTHVNLEAAISEVAQVLRTTGVEVSTRKIHVQSEEQAHDLGIVSSPTIRINGQDIQPDVKESPCEPCGDLCGCGEGVTCRVWTHQGQEYTTPPKAMIVEAILAEVYGGTKTVSPIPLREAGAPDNLKRFFAAGQGKEAEASPGSPPH